MKKYRIVVTGINGFVGHHLAKKLHTDSHEVIGIGQDTVLFPDLAPFVTEYYSADLTTSWPDIPVVNSVIHLAGLAAVGPSFDHPQRYINGNSAMVTNMAEYFLKQETKPRILIVSSGAVYDAHQSMPLNETSAISFSSPYVVSKILTENQAQYYRQRGLDCIVVRPFNHIGPGQASGFILPDFYERVTRLSPDSHVINVGNITTKRDYTDVRDVVDAYSKLATIPELQSSVYNICSGRSTSGKELVEILQAALKRPDIEFKIDPSLIRPTDAPNIYGDASRIQQELGWKPHFTLAQTVADFVASARPRLNSSPSPAEYTS